MESPDLLIVGAGPVGCVVAERASQTLGWRCLVVDKRDHIAGNCYDRLHETGVLIHQYGPHLFRANDTSILDYLSSFTDWIPGNYLVRSCHNGVYYPFPINLLTLEQFFQRQFTPQSAQAYLETLRIPNASPQNSEELVLSKVGQALYEAFYRDYTLKQWGRPAREMDASVCSRIPIRFNRDCQYVDARHQVMPAEGFTAMFAKMLAHPHIRVLLNTDYNDVRDIIRPRYATVYCGPVDTYFDYRLGHLEWRSLQFEFVPMTVPYQQPCAILSYPTLTVPYTRVFESKHLTGQQHPYTVLSYEYPQAEGDPYYPVPSPRNRQLYQAYQELAEAETRRHHVYFAGRLAQYTYINTDEAIAIGLETAEKLRSHAAFLETGDK